MAAVDGETRRRNSGPADPPFSFGDIADRYDALNRLMSLGRDRRWRRIAAEAARPPPGGRVLDVGVGTGELALASLERRPGVGVAGVDPTVEMMRVGQRKPGAERLRWTQGDGLRLPFPDRCFDAVLSAFLLRNVSDVAGALAEQRRVVCAGGRAVCLEMTWPRDPIFGTLFRLYFSELVPLIAGTLSGQPAAYRHLPRSVERFLTPEELRDAMERAGFQDVACQRMALGTVALHVGERG